MNDIVTNHINTSNTAIGKLNKLEVIETPPKEIKKISVENLEKDTEKSKSVVIHPKQLEKVAQQLQDFVGDMNKGLEFLVDKDSGRDVIKVIDKESGETVKQYPSEEVLGLVAKLSEATGLFVNSKV